MVGGFTSWNRVGTGCPGRTPTETDCFAAGRANAYLARLHVHGRDGCGIDRIHHIKDGNLPSRRAIGVASAREKAHFVSGRWLGTLWVLSSWHCRRRCALCVDMATEILRRPA